MVNPFNASIGIVAPWLLNWCPRTCTLPALCVVSLIFKAASQPVNSNVALLLGEGTGLYTLKTTGPEVSIVLELEILALMSSESMACVAISMGWVLEKWVQVVAWDCFLIAELLFLEDEFCDLLFSM
ncbi:hypothetical protein NPIL_674601 [Nephila pilipes]|uniref:Uncharacterized protein n=1 Tax=Nephila pilipes TaxID=299642 RepID=A0A8X6UKQ3_NEPPI|nr:hypothetical protein NPIL_674601 [Nephila pilipes]